MKKWIAFAIFVAICALGASLAIPPLGNDYGRWRVVVLQSDDWGLEGWVPDADVANAMPELSAGAPPGLEAYVRSTLESAEDLRDLAALLGDYRDLDGFAPILQANTIVAAPALGVPGGEAMPPAYGFELELPGAAPSAYARPGLWEEVRRLEAIGVWRAELHGLTHLDLRLLREAALAGDPLFARGQELGVVTCSGLGSSSELGHGDGARDRSSIDAAQQRFVQLFGRAPSSTIAPDYRWDRATERAWRACGLEVVQAKAEQRDPSLPHPTRWGRVIKRWRANTDRRRGDLLYLDRVAELEPYGDPSPEARQGALRAVGDIERAWARGAPGIVSIHRLQLVHLDERVAAAGRSQLRALIEELQARGGARFLVDAELAQLEQKKVSVLRRGPSWVVRNLAPGPRSVVLPDRGNPLVFAPGVHRVEVQEGETTDFGPR